MLTYRATGGMPPITYIEKRSVPIANFISVDGDTLEIDPVAEAALGTTSIFLMAMDSEGNQAVLTVNANKGSFTVTDVSPPEGGRIKKLLFKTWKGIKVTFSEPPAISDIANFIYGDYNESYISFLISRDSEDPNSIWIEVDGGWGWRDVTHFRFPYECRSLQGIKLDQNYNFPYGQVSPAEYFFIPSNSLTLGNIDPTDLIAIECSPGKHAGITTINFDPIPDIITLKVNNEVVPFNVTTTSASYYNGLILSPQSSPWPEGNFEITIPVSESGGLSGHLSNDSWFADYPECFLINPESLGSSPTDTYIISGSFVSAVIADLVINGPEELSVVDSFSLFVEMDQPTRPNGTGDLANGIAFSYWNFGGTFTNPVPTFTARTSAPAQIKYLFWATPDGGPVSFNWDDVELSDYTGPVQCPWTPEVESKYCFFAIARETGTGTEKTFSFEIVAQNQG